MATKQERVEGIPEIVRRIEGDLAQLSDRTTPTVRKLRVKYSRNLRELPAERMRDLAFALLSRKDFLYRFIAYELLCFHPEGLHSLNAESLERLGKGLDSWWTVDTFCCLVAGRVWREGGVSDATIRKWAQSNDRWWRRAALVATVPLNNRTQGGRGDVKRTLAICRMLIDDRDDMVVKGLSWALRELAKHEPESVRDFLAEYDQRLAPRVRREVGNKLETGLKNPKRR